MQFDDNRRPQYLFRGDAGSGGTAWEGNDAAEDNWLQRFDVVDIEEGERVTLQPQEADVLIVPLQGHAIVEVSDAALDLGHREDVFSGAPGAVAILPAPTPASVVARSAGAQVAVIVAAQNVPTVHSPSRWTAIVTEERGKSCWRRTVRTLFDVDSPSSVALVGETITPAGNWSSFPPHKHDFASAEESQNEEIYYFRVRPKAGFGVVRLYSPERGLDEAYAVYDGDVLFIPHGYHTVAAPPGYEIYYLWALAGPRKALVWQTDPTHAWIDR